MGNLPKAVEYAESALAAMQLRVPGGSFHPALEPYFQLVVECKNKAGDAEGAEKVREQITLARMSDGTGVALEGLGGGLDIMQ